MNTPDGLENHTHGKQSASESDAKRDCASVQNCTHNALSPHQSGLGGGTACDARSAAQPPALPCLNSNNSDKPVKRYRLKPVPNRAGIYQDRSGRTWDEQSDGSLLSMDMPTSAEAKAAFHLRLNVEAFVQHWGRNHCLFFTITDEDDLHPSQFSRRWNNFLRRSGAWIGSFIRVLEPQRQGRPHYHLLVAVKWDTRPDHFDWEAFNACQEERRQNGLTGHFRELRSRYRISAAPELIVLWSLLRKMLPRYGLGRSELLPLRKGKEAISEYVGQYLKKGLQLRKHSWKGCRRVEFDRRAKIDWIACSRVFAWHSVGATAWRIRVSELARALGVSHFEGIRRKLGPKWAYRLREAITLGSDEDWSILIDALSSAQPG